ncbi:pentatricopeptide repeat-containing protein At1g59720, chloroplastic/mitochondrial-like [Juglans microcarpa x Juglans regia]|uniref:pentatricopeptide repeat-containing protein At1g59720, chloroplastic/mitochondrial-like n=1 Tax=Juglans microcarpa x Juglans regia TaxID=2249226 RepID=UPI001B7DDD99|nr:pentatricopeptide repeat-containing protein At1g59720, chloroplastic/mitochondrial-like [Juglans microcarpa x Juglans regia]
MALTLTPSPPPPIPSASTTKNNNNKNGYSANHQSHSRLLTLLNECTDMSRLKQIHAHTLRTTSTHNRRFVFLCSRILHFSSLVDIDYSFRVFEQIENPNSFMWNALIRACARSFEHKEEAMLLYCRMLEEGIVMPDKHTFPFVLKACAYLFALLEGKQVHAQALKLGYDSDVYISNSLIHLYGTCGCLDLAHKVFEIMPERSLVSWNVIIDACVNLGEFHTSLTLFGEMQKMFEPDAYTMQSVISACAGLRALSLGMWAHACVLRKCGDEMVANVLVNNCLVDMYCKCGSWEIAQQIFERMDKRDVNSWNSMILGLAMHGKAEAALDYFVRMVRTERVVPDSITFVGVLSACNHRGLVNEGRHYFEVMVTEYKIEPQLEHYGCLVDLLARAGLIDEALNLVSNMPTKPDVVIWRSLLDACCKKNAGVELSEELASQILESDGGDCSGVYVLLSRVYASASQWDDVGLVRKLMTDKGVTKEPGCSSIEIDGTSHEFFAGDTSHPQTKEIYQVLDVIEERLESVGHVTDFSQAPMVDEFNDEKQQALRLHSERLAIAYGLLSLKPGTPIRIFKNLRVCVDCHKVTKLISRIYNVEIIVRDRARFHHFKDGTCSCMDYW